MSTDKLVDQLQRSIEKAKRELKEMYVEASAGGSAAKAKVSGDFEVVDIQISDDVLKGGDKEEITETVRTAVNEAIKKAKALREAQFQKETGQVGLSKIY